MSEGDSVSVNTSNHATNCKCCKCGYMSLCDAIKSGKTDTVKDLLQNGVKVVSETDNVSTPLHLAAERRYVSLEVVRSLLDKNAPIDARNGENETPLHLAAKQGYADKVEVLLKNNASVTVQTNEGSTPLILALAGRHGEIVRLILEYVCGNEKDDESSVCPVDERNFSQLNQILLCGPGVRDKINKLLVNIITKEYDHSKNVDCMADYGFVFNREYIDDCLLLSATKKNCFKLIKNILMNYVDLEIPKKHPSLLHAAVDYGQKELIALFLRSGFDVSAKNEGGKTPVCYSLKSYREDDCIEILRLLLGAGADIKEAPELFHRAVTKVYNKFCKILIENGADINALNSIGETPLHLTIPKDESPFEHSWERLAEECKDAKRFEIAKLLLTNFADTKIRAKDGHTSFHRAVLSGKRELVCLFLEFGVYVDARAEDGSTPLHLAANRGHADIVDILCDNHADVDARQNDGSTPLHCCSWVSAGRRSNVGVETLLDNGSNFNAENSDGETALSIALSSGKLDFAEQNEYILELRRIENILHRSHDLVPNEENDFNELEDYVNDGDLDMYDTITTLKKHLIKLEAAGLYVSKKNLSLFKGNHRYSDFKRRCEDEVNRMRSRNLKPPFTLFNILADGRTPSYLKNKWVVQLLKTFRFEAFPIYESLLRANFENSKSRLELLSSGQKSLDFLVKINIRLNGNKCIEALPFELLEQIILYLNDGEITSLNFCKETTKRQVS